MEKKKRESSNTSDNTESIIIEGLVKFRDGKKWKSRWCALRKLSPVADYMHLQLYRDVKDQKKGNLPKASLSLRDFIGCESGFTLDKESQTLALLCKESPGVIIALGGPEELLQWKTRATRALSSSSCSRWTAILVSPGPKSGLKSGPVSVHIRPTEFCIVSGVPPKLLAVWKLNDLRRYGIVDGHICFESGSRCGKMSGPWVLRTEKPNAFINALSKASPPPIKDTTNSTLHKRLSEVTESTKNMFQYPEWNLHSGHQLEYMSRSDLNDSSSSVGDKEFGSNRQISKCASCMSRLGSPTSPWSTESVMDRRSDSDRTSLYSQSSGASDYSIPRGCISKENISNKICNSNRPKSFCPCRHSQRLTGAYDNYDIPKPPMPLIREYTITGPEIFYDKPKNFTKCLINNSYSCNCYSSSTKLDEKQKDLYNINSGTPHDHSALLKISVNSSNDTNISQLKSVPPVPRVNIIDTCELEKERSSNLIILENSHNDEICEDVFPDLSLFENSTEILKNAGFSQAEIDGMEDEIINDKVLNTCEKKDTKDIQQLKSKAHSQITDTTQVNIFNESPAQQPKSFPLTVNANFNKRKSSSAEFLKRAEEFLDITKSNSHKEMSIDFNPLIKSYNYECVNINCSRCINKLSVTTFDNNNKEKKELINSTLNTVKIRRSSSVPNKCLKNRESSSSSDSGVSTGSYKHPKCYVSQFQVANNGNVSKSNVKHKNNKNILDPSTSIEKITFQFDKAYGLVKSHSYNAENNFIKQTERDIRSSPISCGSDTSDYFESLSLSSAISSSEVSNRSFARPRSGREYSTVIPIKSSIYQYDMQAT